MRAFLDCLELFLTLTRNYLTLTSKKQPIFLSRGIQSIRNTPPYRDPSCCNENKVQLPDLEATEGLLA
jgi:hypothetical protein